MGLLKTKRNGQLVAYRLDKAAIIVGSGDACNIKVPDAGVSARHCQILKMENGFVLRDMSGDVGTFVNGKKVKEHLLSDRDLIQVGKERFTFSISEGENTARVAVSVAPAPATARAGGATARVAAPPAKSGNTGRVAAAPAAEAPRKTERTEMAARTTSRMAPPAASEGGGRSTQRVGKGTQRMGSATGGTKKITARSAASMGYQTSRATFAMPSTRKGKLIAIGGVLFILALGGGLYLLKAGQVDPDKVRAEMNAELAEVKKFKPDQLLEIDKALADLLAKHQPNQPYVAQRYSEIEREYKKIHVFAEDLRKANKEVLPFFTKYAAVKAKPEDLKAQAQKLYDECNSLKDSYGITVHGDRLRAILEELKKILEDRGPSWEQNIVPLQGEVRAATKKGDFAGAQKIVTDFGEKFNEKDNLQLIEKLKEQREFIKRESLAFVTRETGKAQKDLAAEGAKKDEIKKRLEAFKPGLEGFKEALEKLDAFIAGIK